LGMSLRTYGGFQVPFWAAAATSAMLRGLTLTLPSPTIAAAFSPSLAGVGIEPVKAGTLRPHSLPMPSCAASLTKVCASILPLSCARVVLQDAAKWPANVPSPRGALVNVCPPTLTLAGQDVSLSW